MWQLFSNGYTFHNALCGTRTMCSGSRRRGAIQPSPRKSHCAKIPAENIKIRYVSIVVTALYRFLTSLNLMLDLQFRNSYCVGRTPRASLRSAHHPRVLSKSIDGSTRPEQASRQPSGTRRVSSPHQKFHPQCCSRGTTLRCVAGNSVAW